MSLKAEEIIKKIKNIAPEEICCNWDNVGVMVGDINREVKKVLIALDCSDAVINEAVKENADMIITHHPFIFKPIKSLDYSLPISKKIVKVIKNDIVVYSAHTNLDIADFGTNFTLARLLELQNTEGLIAMSEGNFMGRVGELKEEMTFGSLINFVKSKLGTDKLAVNGDINTKIKKIGLCTGAGADYEYMKMAKDMGCQAYITGDVGYHDAQIAEDIGICLIDGTHYLTEVIVVNTLYDILSKAFNQVEFIKSQVDGQTLKII